eukprot:147169_1
MSGEQNKIRRQNQQNNVQKRLNERFKRLDKKRVRKKPSHTQIYPSNINDNILSNASGITKSDGNIIVSKKKKKKTVLQRSKTMHHSNSSSNDQKQAVPINSFKRKHKFNSPKSDINNDINGNRSRSNSVSVKEYLSDGEINQIMSNKIQTRKHSSSLTNRKSYFTKGNNKYTTNNNNNNNNNKEEKGEKINILKLQQTISHVFRRTFCSLHNGNLYNTYCYIGTKHIIEKYYKCLSQCVELIADKSTNTNETIEYFYRCKRSLGRTALCLSGGGSLSMTHCGVIRVLVLNNCLPKVISGTSGGAILAGYLAVITDEEIKSNIDEHFGYKIANQYGTRFLPTFFEQLFGAYRDRVLMPDTSYFINSIKKYVGNLTFKEAWIKTGRHVNISVSYSTKNKTGPYKHQHAHYILLNHITSPNVYIWSAITASCALPGLMKPQQLWSKNEKNNNQKIPYYPDGIQWVDGSLQADIPIKLLQELFRVNYTIVSQVNPHVTPFLITTKSGTQKQFGLKLLEILDDMASRTVNHQLDRLVKLKAIPAVYGHNFDKFALQNFTGDITIVPRIPLNLRFKILSHPTDQDMKQYIDIGEKATWIHLQHIQTVLKIENLIDKTIINLKKKKKK